MTASLLMMRLTFLEAVRRRIAIAALVLGLAFLLLYGIGFHYAYEELPQGSSAQHTLIRKQVTNFLLMAGLYAANFLTVVMAVMVSADTLAGEIASGTIQTIAYKPIRRAEIVAGKWLGFACLLGAYLLLLGGGVQMLAYLKSGYLLPHLVRGIGLMLLESLLLMTVTLACSSVLSTLAAGGTVLGLYGLSFLGGWVEQIGAAFKNETAVNVGILTSLLMPAEALWKRASYEMTSPLIQSIGMGAGPFSVLSLPNAWMVAYAAVYLVAAFLFAVRRFSHRDL